MCLEHDQGFGRFSIERFWLLTQQGVADVRKVLQPSQVQLDGYRSGGIDREGDPGAHQHDNIDGDAVES